VRLVTGARTDEALLWALACGLSVSGGEGMKLIEVEGHGRRGEAVGADLTRTVGWFTLIYPVAVEVNSRKSLREQITEVRRNVRRAQEASLGYAVAKYVRGDGEAGRRLRQMPEAEALFNYLGRVNERGAGGAVISGVEMDVEYCSAEQNKGSHRLEVNAVEVGGELEFEVSYSPEEVSEEEVREVIEGMKERIDEAIVESERWIEEIGRRCGVGVEEVEEVYALSPMQEGLLFHALYEAGGAAYWVQTRMKLEGEVDDRRMRQAWEEVVARREALRVSLLWEGVDRPVQVVRRTARVEMEVEDWRSMSEGEQEQEMGLRLRRERQEGVDIRRGPMMRVRLMRKQEREYEMQWSSHHLALDGWSAAIVLKEVLERYERGMGGQEAALEAEPVKYGQYVEWVEGCDRRKARRYWEARMKGVAGKTRLRVERVAVEEEGDRGEAYGKQEVRVSRDRSRVIEDEARRAGVTMNTVAQGGWAIVMGEYSGDEEVVYGATVSGRGIGMEGIEEVVGVCINTAPVRVEVRGEQSVGEWLRGIQRKEVEGREYEYVGLAEVQRWVRGAGRGEGAGEEGMFDALLVFENYPVDSSLLDLKQEGGSIRVTDVDVIERTHYPLAVTVTPGRELVIEITYSRARFEDEAVRRMLDHLLTAIDKIAANMDAQLSSLDLLTESERRQLLNAWNVTEKDYPQEVCLHQIIEAQVDRTPDGIAVVFENEQLSYRELNSRANRLARRLQASGIGPDKVVGVCMERSSEMVVALIGVLKAGGAYAPIDPSYPKERVAFILEDASASVILAQSRFAKELPGNRAEVICLDLADETMADGHEENIASGASEDNVAYVLFTSGSTGRPKGVMITHRAICNHMFWMQRLYPLTDADRVLQKTQFSFDASVWEFYAPLIAGARLVMARSGWQLDSSYLIKKIDEEKITILQLVPTLLRMLLEHQDFDMCVSLRRVFCGGEPLIAGLRDGFYARLNADLINLYGPTETTVEVTSWTCRRDQEGSNVPIGRPIDNTRIYITNSHLRPVPAGVPGELSIGGKAPGRGYYNRPELTAERFVPDPFSKEPGARIYMTGDLARYRPDGVIEFLGRMDYQVKLRGRRIELGEIEAVLKERPSVREAVVALTDDSAGGKALVAYVVAEADGAVSASELREFLRGRVPEYMVPKIIMLDALPLTPSGKLDRLALPNVEGLAQEPPSAGELPRNELEQAIAQIWQDALDLKGVGIRDNFFDLGGDSIRMIRVLGKLRETIKPDLEIVALFNYPTVESLAAYVNERGVKEPSFTRAVDRAKKRSDVETYNQAKARREAIDKQKRLMERADRNK